jgi:hypothetical protein
MRTRLPHLIGLRPLCLVARSKLPMNNNRSLVHRALRCLGQLIGNLNVFLFPVAICLLVLEATLVATVILSDELLHRHGSGMASAIYRTPALVTGSRGFNESW